MSYSLITLLAIGLLLSPLSTAHAFLPAENGTSASEVFGQPDFFSSGTGSNTQGSMNTPTDVELALNYSDTAMFVVDQGNHRVLFYRDLTDTIPDQFLGDPAGANGTSDTLLLTPEFLDLWEGTDTTVLFVSESSNNRVLAYIVSDASNDTPFPVEDGGRDSFEPDTRADYVFGQPDFTTSAIGSDSDSLKDPVGVALDTHADTIDLYVSDAGNDRVVRFTVNKNSFGNAGIDTGIDQAWGSDTTSAGPGAAVGDTVLDAPHGLFISENDNLFIADRVNNRVVQEDLTDGDTTFDQVWGQPDFFTKDINTDTFGFSAPRDVVVSGTDLAISDANDRIMFYDLPFDGTDTAASSVIGDSDFSATTDPFATTDTRTVSVPEGLFMLKGSLLVAESGGDGHRVTTWGGAVGSSSDEESGCLIERTGAPETVLDRLRTVRDWMLRTSIGRRIVTSYYDLAL